MMQRRALGELELLLLLCLERLGEPAYGVTIGEAVAARTGRTVAPGAIYTTMARLERRGLVSSFLGDPTPQRGGRRKRFYELLPVGRRALADATGMLQRMAAAPAGREEPA
jgi:DNA-binding PadR family transcriptional regulator